jgi:AcrR family transcriptional regulator
LHVKAKAKGPSIRPLDGSGMRAGGGGVRCRLTSAPNIQLKLANREPRSRNYAATRQAILQSALKAFAQHGYAAATTDIIAASAGVTKRLVFYYFKTKSLLFTAVLEHSYSIMRTGELELELHRFPPKEAIRTLVEWTFDFDFKHSHFVRVVMIENILLGRHMAKSTVLKQMAMKIIDQLGGVIARGVDAGVFRKDLEPVEVHAIISSLCFFAVENRHTFAAQFGYNMASRRTHHKHKALVVELVERFLEDGRTPSAAQTRVK